MTKSLIEQRDGFLYRLGLLLHPLKELFANPTWKSSIDQVEGRYTIERDAFFADVAKYCEQIGIANGHLFVEIRRTSVRIATVGLAALRGDSVAAGLRQFTELEEKLKGLIRSLPAVDPDTILPAALPFTAYMRLLSHCRSATTRLQIFDPYLYPAIYHRYLAEVPPTVAITVITSDTKSLTTPAKRDPIIAISEIFAQSGQTPTNFVGRRKRMIVICGSITTFTIWARD